MSDLHTPPAHAQAGTWLLSILFITLCVVSWLAWQRFDSIAYMTTSNTASTGWAAFRAGWPVFALAGVVTAIFGSILGLWAGKNARIRDAETRAEHANAQAVEAAKKAENAQDRAEAALAEKIRRAERTEKEARQAIIDAEKKAHEAIIASKTATSLAKNSTNELLERVTFLTKELAQAEHARTNAYGKMRRLERKIERHGGFADDVDGGETEKLRGMIREDRQQIHKLEERLRAAKSAAS